MGAWAGVREVKTEGRMFQAGLTNSGVEGSKEPGVLEKVNAGPCGWSQEGARR